MADGGVMTVSALNNGGEIQINIADNGCGIPAEKIPLIFEPFYTSKGQGTGLGLAISYNIIYDHGGKIDVESKRGKGTMVVVHLPLEPSLSISG